jgi:hypothetical protein
VELKEACKNFKNVRKYQQMKPGTHFNLNKTDTERRK